MDTHSPSAAASQVAPCGHSAFVPTTRSEAAPGNLPAWADNETGHELVAQILANTPATRVFDNGMSRFGGEEYVGVAACRLRRLFSRGLERLTTVETAAYRAGEPYRHLTDQVQSYLLQERPDALIARLLSGRPR